MVHVLVFPKGTYAPQVTTSREISMEQFKELLRRVDANNDGLISKGELREALRGLGLHFTRWRARRAMKYADSNGNGHIDGDSEIKALIQVLRDRWGIVVKCP
uniref:Putative calcium-binding protein CML23 n=1 Tax=Anthurium amnicola TaxID=1678845 RepID=A0A1D1YDZ7_9ARAE